MINNTPNNLSFSGRFIFKGNKQETSDFVKFIKNEISMTDEPKALINSINHNGDTFILTSTDCLLEKLAPNIDHFVKNNHFLYADKFYSKNKKNLLSSILDFDPICGEYQKRTYENDKGMKTYSCKHFYNDGEINKSYSERVDFNKKINISEAFALLESLKPKRLLEICTQIHINSHFQKYKKAVKNEKLKDIAVTGLAGAGGDSLVFIIDNNKALKLSHKPCYPKIAEPFDTPINDSGFIKTDEGIVYFCTTPKGQNSEEIRISAEHVNEVIDKIEKYNYKSSDDIDYIGGTHQIVLLEGKPYLCDYDCATNKDGTSRLFLAPEAGEK